MKWMRFLCFLVLGVMSLVSHAQDTIFLQQINIQGDAIGKDAVKPLLARKLDTLVLQSQATSNLSQLLIQHSPVFIKTYGPGGT